MPVRQSPTCRFSTRSPQSSRTATKKVVKKSKKPLLFSAECIIIPFVAAGMMELADVLDSKSSGSDTVRVRPPLPAPDSKSSQTP